MPSSDAEHVRRLYRSLYAIVRRIPRGRVITYGQLAELAGLPGRSRVAGAAMRTSTGEAGLPWQRVIGKAGPRRGRIAILDPVGAAVQRELLTEEGVTVGDSGLVALDLYGWLPDAAAPPPKRQATGGSGRAASPRPRPRSGSTRRASSSRR